MKPQSKQSHMKRFVFSFICIVFIASTMLPLFNREEGKVFAEEESTAEQQSPLLSTSAYIEPYYLSVLRDWENKGYEIGGDQIEFSATDFIRQSEDAVMEVGSYAGENNVLYWKNPRGWVEYEVNIDKPGLYEISTEYMPFAQADGGSRQAAIIGVQVNGEYPYREARSIQLRREYRDLESGLDKEGNEVRALIEEVTEWTETPLREPGVSVNPLLFYFEKGKNTIRVLPLRESVAIKSFEVKTPTDLPSYEEVKASYPQGSSGKTFTHEAEDFLKKNSTSIQVQYDRDPLTTPKSLKRIKFNAIGGYSWYNGGQAVTWEIDVPESGEYKIAFRGMQNFRESLASFRTIYINGEIPFEEMKLYKVPYATGWQGITIQDEDGDPYTFYLEEGKNTITMEATYEPFMPIIVQIDYLSEQIRNITQEIQIASGNRVDEFRVWNVETELPGLIDQLKDMREQFGKMSKEIVEINGGRSSVSQSFDSLVDDITSLLKKPNDIPNNPVRIGTMREKLDAQRQSLIDSPLMIEKFYFTPADEDFPRMKANMWEKMVGSFNSLLYSFTDNNQLKEQKDDELNVWMMWGRDYADELQQLADQYFTPEHGITVNVNLIQDPNLLIMAKAAGIMPDLALGIPSDMPFEMALRGAAKDLSQLPGFDEVIENYAPGAMLPYFYDGGYYGIPETINFKILFYRKDILDQLGLEVPNTWDEVYDMIPTLLQNNYNFYADPLDFSYMFFQNDVELYTSDGLSTGLDTPEAFAAFEEWTDLFNLHGMDRQVQSFYQQFRNGTMPIGISDFNQYMQLLVAAPEILDLWGVAPVPGRINENGEIERWAGGTGIATTGMMMFNDTPEEKQELAWEFMKWYVDTETQIEYGLNLEQFRGETFRWNSSNIHAFSQMPWRPDDLDAILEQWRWVKDIPNVPGGYMTIRQINFAWNLTVLEGENPRVELEKAIKEINREMHRKQIEFNIRDENGNVLHRLEMLDVSEPWEGVDRLER